MYADITQYSFSKYKSIIELQEGILLLLLFIVTV